MSTLGSSSMCAMPVALMALLASAPAWAEDASKPDAPVGITDIVEFVNWDMVPVAVLLLVGVFVAQLVTRRLLDDLGERFTDRRLLFKKVSAVTRLTLYLAGGGIALASTLELRSEAMLAIGGTVALAVGLSLQDLLASLMAGVILLIDEPFQVGDRISFGSYYGEVSEIGFRSVRLVTLDDNLVTIPNSAFLKESVASANAGALDCMVVVPFYVAAAEDFQLARRLILEAGATSRYVYLQKPLTTNMSDQFLGERFVTVISLKAYVFDARYEKSLVSDVTERVKLAFREHHVRMPDQAYRDLEVHQGVETPNDSPEP